MRELYRRLGALALLFIAIVFYFTVRESFVRLYRVDMGKEYQSAYSPSQGIFGAQGAAGKFIRSVTPFTSIAEFIDSKTENRLTVVKGAPWPDIFTGILSPSDRSPIAWREAGKTYGKDFYYHGKEEPFSALVTELVEESESFRYLKYSFPSGPQYLGMVMEGPGTAIGNGVPSAVAHPFRSLTALPLLLGAALYLFIPRKKHPAGAILYPRWSAVILPDLIAFTMAALFLGMPFVLSVHIFDRADILDFSYGSAWFTLLFWLIGLIFASILCWSAKYASFALQILPESLILQTMEKEQRIAFADIVSAEFADYRPPRWLRTIMFIAGLVNWRMIGQALLLSSRTDWGVEFRLTSGGRVKFLCSNIPGAEKIFEALRLHKIPLSAELEGITASKDCHEPEQKR